MTAGWNRLAATALARVVAGEGLAITEAEAGATGAAVAAGAPAAMAAVSAQASSAPRRR
ncbi:MAG: hypothetical protein M3415_00165 [Actinomycetota bacterium]|jgi:hypothetical protein|nr:hypothetical protein [Actinomycetota bacterium]